MTAMQHVPCALCDSPTAVPWFTGRDRGLGHPGRFFVVRCQRCGLARQSPRPLDLAPYYEGGYPQYTSDLYTWRPWWRRGVPDAVEYSGSGGIQWKLIRRMVPWRSGRILDIGCGNGDLLTILDRAGWEVHGYEPHAPTAMAADHRLCHLGRTVVHSDAAILDAWPAQSFDVITLWHVIEHLPEPLAMMRTVRRLLRPGGLCLIQTPHVAAAEALLLRSYWHGWELPRHLWFFSHTTLQALLERAGLTVWARPVSNSYDIAVLSLGHVARAALGVSLGGRVVHLARSGPVQALARAGFLVLDHAGLGSQLTVVAVRPLDHPAHPGAAPRA
ncbi:MAG: methyltransferase domain-containing protein [Chloroflexi bacterium]|nr:methyltransferase domain-containing protein [Chloroflexota bacterium]